MSVLRDALTRVFHDSRYQVGVDLHEPESGYRECERFADDAIFFGAERLLTAALLDEGLLATALEGYELVPYKPSPGDDYEEHRQGAAKVIAAAYRLAAYRASQEKV